MANPFRTGPSNGTGENTNGTGRVSYHAGNKGKARNASLDNSCKLRQRKEKRVTSPRKICQRHNRSASSTGRSVSWGVVNNDQKHSRSYDLGASVVKAHPRSCSTPVYSDYGHSLQSKTTLLGNNDDEYRRHFHGHPCEILAGFATTELLDLWEEELLERLGTKCLARLQAQADLGEPMDLDEGTPAPGSNTFHCIPRCDPGRQALPTTSLITTRSKSFDRLPNLNDGSRGLETSIWAPTNKHCTPPTKDARRASEWDLPLPRVRQRTRGQEKKSIHTEKPLSQVPARLQHTFSGNYRTFKGKDGFGLFSN
ncbi:hypothetical protein PVAG01_06382 [Phlyctema vagabunda]|uniref:DUF4685 domain-containing protein n=1 Tax=Phlyctema vagabunda TaxID=108571 RepID=A0ABR4PGU4_9HELO